VRCDALRASARAVQFGVRDLVLAEDFTACSSEVEASYGIGLRPGSAEARSMLAGAPEFKCAVVELWSIYSDVGDALEADEASSAAGSGSLAGAGGGGGGGGSVAESAGYGGGSAAGSAAGSGAYYGGDSVAGSAQY
jgi:hypothetical protein